MAVGMGTTAGYLEAALGFGPFLSSVIGYFVGRSTFRNLVRNELANTTTKLNAPPSGYMDAARNFALPMVALSVFGAVNYQYGFEIILTQAVMGILFHKLAGMNIKSG